MLETTAYEYEAPTYYVVEGRGGRVITASAYSRATLEDTQIKEFIESSHSRLDVFSEDSLDFLLLSIDDFGIDTFGYARAAYQITENELLVGETNLTNHAAFFERNEDLTEVRVGQLALLYPDDIRNNVIRYEVIIGAKASIEVRGLTPIEYLIDEMDVVSGDTIGIMPHTMVMRRR